MRYEVKGKYEISVTGKEDYKEFTIPGSAMDSFLKSGDIPDPFYGENEGTVREFLDNDFTVKGVFFADKEALEKKHQEIILKRIDTICDVFLNGELIKHCENAHIKYRVDVTGVLKEQNDIEFRFKSPVATVNAVKPGPDREITMVNTGTMPNSQYIRKPHCSFGWDWGPQLPDTGIYEEPEIIAYDDIRLDNIWVRQNHSLGTNKVGLKVFTQGVGIVDATITVKVTDPEGDVVYEGPEYNEIEIEDPELWWPNGYGEQPLYTVTVTASDYYKKEVNVLETRVGIRSLYVSRKSDEWGKEFAFVCNGVKIFARGADYIPSDCYLGRIDKDVIKRDIDAALFANYNCLRVWGGGFYPSDYFYDLCDEQGIIIWQDFMFACNIYDLTSRIGEGESFEDLVKTEVRFICRQLRNHPCLGLLCGNNEMEEAWINWENTKHHSQTLKDDYLKQFEKIMPATAYRYAPDTFYMPSSPTSGGGFNDPNSENEGDAHYWEVWHGLKPFRDYENHYFRFLSEFGFQSFPSMKTIRTFITSDDDLKLDSKVMEAHQKNPSANAKIKDYLKEYFKEPKDFEELVLFSQVMQGVAMKTAVDHMRRNRGRCMGSLYWQFNDNSPVASWSSMDYFGRYKALHYMAKRFYAPISASLVTNGSNCEVWVSNENRQKFSYLGYLRLKTLDFKVLYEDAVDIYVPRATAVKVKEIDFGDILKQEGLTEKDVFIEFTWGDRTEWTTFVPLKDMDIEEPVMKVDVVDGQKNVWVSAERFVPYVILEGTDSDIIFEDNCFAITSSEPVVIKL